MPPPFSTLEDRVNSMALRKLANATATISGVDYDGIFDNPDSTSEGGFGMAVSMPTFTMETASVPVNPKGRSVVVRGATYQIEDVKPDGRGMTVLHLEQAA